MTLAPAAGSKKARTEVLFDALGGDSDATPLSELYAKAFRSPPTADPLTASRGYWLLNVDARLEPEPPLPAGVSRGAAIVLPVAVCVAP